MVKVQKIYEQVIKKMKEDDGTGVIGTETVPAMDAPKGMPDIEKIDDKATDITANYKPGTGTKEVLGKFDPNNGIMGPDDYYLPGKKKKVEKRSSLLPDDMQVIEDEGGEVKRDEDKKTKGKK